jgi:outer membrane protein OmpA-like peptidoglycan-associated protein
MIPSAQRNAAPPPPEPASQLPPLPAAPPPAPALPGAPPAKPAPVPALHPPAIPVAEKPPGPPVAVAFPAGSAVLPSVAAAPLKQLATQRGNGTIMVVGYGEAATTDPSGQQAALALALSRAQAVASVLAASGVPADHIQIDAEAGGRGAAARVIN